MCAVILSNTFKGTFAPIAFKLVDIGGGNKSNMSCGGSYTGAGAKQLANLTKTLFDCEVEVRHCQRYLLRLPSDKLINSQRKPLDIYNTMTLCDCKLCNVM